MNKIYFMLIQLLFMIFIYSADTTPDLTLDPDNNNSFFRIDTGFSIDVNDRGELSYHRYGPDDEDDFFYPTANIRLQAAYLFPVHRTFNTGPSIFNDNLFRVFHHNDDREFLQSMQMTFNSVILPGISFQFTPYSARLNMPVCVLQIDAGPGFEINNNREDGDDLNWKAGGFCTQTLILPVMPVHLFVMDVNIIAILAVNTPSGWFPGVIIKNHFLMKFAFFNFVNKKAGSGVRLKNIYSYTLTGKPSLTDLSSQYTYNRFSATLYFGALAGLEIHQGYGFEYITRARENTFHTGHKLVSMILWSKNNFRISFTHTLEFWDSGINNAVPLNSFDITVAYGIQRF